MGTILTIVLRMLKLNKKRTILTVLTIVLAVGMITAVLSGGWSMLRFLQEKEKIFGGDYEYRIENLTWEQIKELKQIENVDNVSALHYTGYSFYGEKSNQTMLSIAEVNDVFYEQFYLGQYLQEGRYPINGTEIAISYDFIKENGLLLSVGDSITLTIGTRVWDELDTELYGMTNYMGERESFHPVAENSYTIVGIFSDMNGSKLARDFNAFTGISASENTFTAYVKSNQISKAIYTDAESNAALVGGQVADYHSTLLMYHGVTGGKGGIKVLLAVSIVILLLVAASSAMISNILSISLQERLKQLGMLSSIGATSRQKKASVVYEAFLLGVMGIPLGLGVGYGLAAVVLGLIRLSFEASFASGIVQLKLYGHWGIFLISAAAGILSLVFASRTPGKVAAKVTVIDSLRQTNVFQLGKKKMYHGKLMALVFGIYGSLAAKNIRRNPKRFRAITGSVFLATVLGLSLYSLADFMIFQTSMDMKEDGSCYVDVEAAIPYGELQTAVKALSEENISADVSCHLSRYMTGTFDASKVNAEMSGYFINGNLGEIYVVGMDKEHFMLLCEENGLDRTAYAESVDRGILINSATGNYGESANRVVIGSPFNISKNDTFQLEYGSEECPAIIVQDVIDGDNANIQSRYVRDRAILIVPLDYFAWMMKSDTYINLAITTAEHEEVAECLTNSGYFQTVDVAKATENSRQIFLILKLAVCIFAVLMTMIIGLNVCNTISNTIYVRRSEFAVLRSIGMTEKGLKHTLLLEAILYGVKALLLAIPISLIIHYIMYRFICTGMTPFVFYIKLGSYGIAVLAVVLVVIGAMLFSIRSVSKVEIVKELKMGRM